MRLRALLILALCILFAVLPPKAIAAGGLVVEVHDGDTFTLNTGERVRLDGIDAPELKQPYGQESKEQLERLILNRIIDIRCDGKSYNRKLCRISCDDVDIQREMVKRGLAFDYTYYSQGFYKSAEDFAQRLQRGVWVLPNGGERPWYYRRKKKGKKN